MSTAVIWSLSSIISAWMSEKHASHHAVINTPFSSQLTPAARAAASLRHAG
jgi:hypothetical protein